MSVLNVDDFLTRLLNVGQSKLTANIKQNEIFQLCLTVKNIFQSQGSMIELEPPVVICGDIHGQYGDLLRIFDKNGFPSVTNYLFLGDYVDRGQQNIETICLLFCYKIKYPNNFFLLRGNHECAMINRFYGFFDEIDRRYNDSVLWQTFQETFDWMPMTALVGSRILCMHGGLSPELKNLNQLRNLPRPYEPQNPSLGLDLLWSDPDPFIKGWKANTRGASYIFGKDVVINACRTLDVDLIARAHQVVQDGYEFFADRRLVTIFSAPHYCGEFDNLGATMTVSEDLSCSFSIYHPIY